LDVYADGMDRFPEALISGTPGVALFGASGAGLLLRPKWLRDDAG
jgi:hypothetical protein